MRQSGADVTILEIFSSCHCRLRQRLAEYRELSSRL